MKCPKCKSRKRTKVLDSRSRGNQLVYRRRECVSCGHRFNTWESPMKVEIRQKFIDNKLSDIKQTAERIIKEVTG